MENDLLHGLKDIGVPPLIAFVVWRFYQAIAALKQGQQLITGMVVRIALKQGWIEPRDLPQGLKIEL